MKKIQTILCLPVLFFLLATNTKANSEKFFKQATPSIEGHWDIIIQQDGKELPSWLEIIHSGRGTLVGRFVYAFGSARPVAHIKPTNGKYSFFYTRAMGARQD